MASDNEKSREPRKQYVPGIPNVGLIWGVIVLGLLLLLTIYSFVIMRSLTNSKSEKFSASSYSSGADQRFEQRNSDPTLGKQFAPYNMEITGEKALFGSNAGGSYGGHGYDNERMSSMRESPVIYNIGSDMGGQPYPPGVSMHYPKPPEAGLAPSDDSPVNGEGTPGDGMVEDLINELYG